MKKKKKGDRSVMMNDEVWLNEYLHFWRGSDNKCCRYQSFNLKSSSAVMILMPLIRCFFLRHVVWTLSSCFFFLVLFELLNSSCELQHSFTCLCSCDSLVPCTGAPTVSNYSEAQTTTTHMGSAFVLAALFFLVPSVLCISPSSLCMTHITHDFNNLAGDINVN